MNKNFLELSKRTHQLISTYEKHNTMLTRQRNGYIPNNYSQFVTPISKNHVFIKGSKAKNEPKKTVELLIQLFLTFLYHQLLLHISSNKYNETIYT